MENTFHRKNFIDILVHWIRTLENYRDSVHMHNYRKKRNIKKYKFWVHWFLVYGNLPINTWKREFWKDTHFFLYFRMCSNLAKSVGSLNIKPFHFSSPIFKLPINFHHQYSAAGTDMAKMHWFVLKGGMFTEIKPDSVKAKHMLQHENPAPSKMSL